MKKTILGSLIISILIIGCSTARQLTSANKTEVAEKKYSIEPTGALSDSLEFEVVKFMKEYYEKNISAINKAIITVEIPFAAEDGVLGMYIDKYYNRQYMIGYVMIEDCMIQVIRTITPLDPLPYYNLEAQLKKAESLFNLNNKGLINVDRLRKDFPATFYDEESELAQTLIFEGYGKLFKILDNGGLELIYSGSL